MLFSDATALTSVFANNVNISVSFYGADSILSFNEPDSCYTGSACMTVAASVAAYLKYIQPYASSNPALSLGAPAVTNSGATGASLTYLSYFLGNCTGCSIDFVPIHWYSNPYAFDYFQTYVQQAYVASGNRTLWITEFGMDSTSYDDALVQSFMTTALSWLDSLSYVRRYAWFGDYPGYLVNSAGTGLSADGVTFNNYTRPYTTCAGSGYAFC